MIPEMIQYEEHQCNIQQYQNHYDTRNDNEYSSLMETIDDLFLDLDDTSRGLKEYQ